jgi:hypothetical protein
MRETAAQANAPVPAGNGNAAAPQPAAPPTPTLADPGSLGALLKRQAELANDVSPAGEAEYAAVVREIATLQ